jgi:hypothetical protein
MKWRKKLLISLTMAGVGFAIQQTPVGGVIIPTKDTIQEVENFTPPPPKDVKENLGTYNFQIAGSSIAQLKQDLMVNISNTEIPYDLNWLKNYVGRIGSDLPTYPVACIEWVGDWCRVFEEFTDYHQQEYPTGEQYEGYCDYDFDGDYYCYYYDIYKGIYFAKISVISGVPYSVDIRSGFDWENWKHYYLAFWYVNLYFNGLPIKEIRWRSYSDDGVEAFVYPVNGRMMDLRSGCWDDSGGWRWCNTYHRFSKPIKVNRINFNEDGGDEEYWLYYVDIKPAGQRYVF